ncbi:MAG: aminopeptidase P family protein [FCB group bacterium]|nr:aminopeptidase P family protein [FCB group bacterium]
MEARIAKLRNEFDKLGIDAFLSNRLSNVRHLCGYSGSSGLLFVTRQEAFLLTDFRYKEQVKREVQGAESFIIKKDFPTEFKDNEKLHFKGKIGIEAPWMNVSLLTQMQEAVPGCEWINTENVAEEIASVKDNDEIEKIRAAVQITDKVFEELLTIIKPGVREIDIAAEIVYRHMQHGAEGNSFDSIVASGVNGSLPHAGASDKKIEVGDLVTIDFGCIYQGYCSDMTRTVAVGQPSAKQKEIYDIVLHAQDEATKAIKAGITGFSVDKVARDIITEAGYGENFGHGLGHGLGIEVHAHPRLSHLFVHELFENQVVTVEPGIYISGFGGVRIENDVVVKKDGYEDLTGSVKELIVLDV